MVKKREGYQFIVHDPAKTWVASDKCGGCGKPKNEWKRSTRWKCCSTECTEKYVRECTSFGWGEFRLRVFKRDNYTCKICGKKPIPMCTEFEKVYDGQGKHDGWKPKKIIIENPSEYDYASCLIGDHIVPISLSGNEWDMENIQTLCIACNKKKTRIDAGNIAKERLKEKLIGAGQKFLKEVDNAQRNI